jgi:hypothetical protein
MPSYRLPRPPLTMRAVSGATRRQDIGARSAATSAVGATRDGDMAAVLRV